MDAPITFSGSPLARIANGGPEPAWVEAQLAREATRVLALWRLEPLVKRASPRRLAWATPDLFADLDPAPPPVLLGMQGDVAHFALDVSSVAEPATHFGVGDVAAFEDLRGVAGQLAPGDAAVAAQARSLLDWHARHAWCPACGGKTRAAPGGGQRRCVDCAAEHFPRTDPVAIALVHRGDRCLLGRGRGWPPAMFSALAGFVEAGETLEEAVRREVLEESGVHVGGVRYLVSQPWPFPSSLMLGCLAEATSEALRVDPSELEEARWFGADAVRAALAGRGAGLVLPPPFAVAHHLIRAWVETRGA